MTLYKEDLVVNIRLSENERIIADKFQFIYQKRKVGKSGKGEGVETWESEWYYREVEYMLTDLADVWTKLGKATTFKELFEDYKKNTDKMIKLIRGLRCK